MLEKKEVWMKQEFSSSSCSAFFVFCIDSLMLERNANRNHLPRVTMCFNPQTPIRIINVFLLVT